MMVLWDGSGAQMLLCRIPFLRLFLLVRPIPEVKAEQLQKLKKNEKKC